MLIISILSLWTSYMYLFSTYDNNGVRVKRYGISYGLLILSIIPFLNIVSLFLALLIICQDEPYQIKSILFTKY